MIISISNLPLRTLYCDVRDLIRSTCGLQNKSSLENLLTEGNNMSVMVNVKSEQDASLLVRSINGMYYKGHQLYAQELQDNGQKPEQSYPSRVWYKSGKKETEPAYSQNTIQSTGLIQPKTNNAIQRMLPTTQNVQNSNIASGGYQDHRTAQQILPQYSQQMYSPQPNRPEINRSEHSGNEWSKGYSGPQPNRPEHSGNEWGERYSGVQPNQPVHSGNEWSERYSGPQPNRVDHSGNGLSERFSTPQLIRPENSGIGRSDKYSVPQPNRPEHSGNEWRQRYSALQPNQPVHSGNEWSERFSDPRPIRPEHSGIGRSEKHSGPQPNRPVHSGNEWSKGYSGPQPIRPEHSGNGLSERFSGPQLVRPEHSGIGRNEKYSGPQPNRPEHSGNEWSERYSGLQPYRPEHNVSPASSQKRSWHDSNRQYDQSEFNDSQSQQPQAKKLASVSIGKNNNKKNPKPNKMVGVNIMKSVGTIMYEMGRSLKLWEQFKECSALKAELRRAIHNRIRELVADEVLSPDEIVKRYRRIYPKSYDATLYVNIQKNVLENDHSNPTRSRDQYLNLEYTKPGQGKNKKKKALKQKLRPADSIPPTIMPIPQALNPQNLPTERKFKKKTKVKKELPPKRLGRIPSYPEGDKQMYKLQKKQEIRDWETMPAYSLDVTLLKAMDEEVDSIVALIEGKFKNSRNEQRKAIYDGVNQLECIDKCKKLLTHHLSKRISNSGVKALRIYGKPKFPRRPELEAYLNNYGCLTLKKSYRAKFYTATFRSYETVDMLCAMDKVSIGETEVCFKLLHAVPKKSKLDQHAAKIIRKKIINSLIEKSEVNLLSKDWPIKDEEEKRAKAEKKVLDDVKKTDEKIVSDAASTMDVKSEDNVNENNERKETSHSGLEANEAPTEDNKKLDWNDWDGTGEKWDDFGENNKTGCVGDVSEAGDNGGEDGDNCSDNADEEDSENDSENSDDDDDDEAEHSDEKGAGGKNIENFDDFDVDDLDDNNLEDY